LTFSAQKENGVGSF